MTRLLSYLRDASRAILTFFMPGSSSAAPVHTNPGDPIVWVRVKRYDGIGKGHRNKILKEELETPHVHDADYPGGIRYPEAWEVPKQR